jgi:ATP-dependent exoDNAse (exonuclease V) beta subunit
VSQTLILELSDAVYTLIQREAEAAGTSPAHWLAKALERQYSPPQPAQNARAQHTAAERQAARERFERHFGAVDRADAVGADNEHIDADLAREYTDAHEAP